MDHKISFLWYHLVAMSYNINVQCFIAFLFVKIFARVCLCEKKYIWCATKLHANLTHQINRQMVKIKLSLINLLNKMKRGCLSITIIIFSNTSDNLNYKGSGVSHAQTIKMPWGFEFKITDL